MKIVCYYNRNLKMSEGKLAAQVGHVCKNLALESASYTGIPGPSRYDDTIIVLGLRQNKFKDKWNELENTSVFKYAQIDKGLTEVEPETITAFGYIEQ